MKKTILLTLSLLMLGLLQAQVGINTENPFGIFHVDPKGDTAGTAAVPTNDTDDVIIQKMTGNLGIGTALPTQKLDVNGSVRIRGGNPDGGKVLTSIDAGGTGLWQTIKPHLDTRLIRIIPGSPFTYQAGTEYTLASFTVSAAGNYIAIFRWWGVINNPLKMKNVHFRIYVNGTLMDQVEHYMTTEDHRNITCFSTAVYAMNTPANATVKITANFVNDSHIISKLVLTEAYNPSIVFFGI